MKKPLKVILMVFIVILVSIATYFSFQDGEQRGIEATVSKIIDGDTVELANGDRVRLIGIDAPEKNQPHYKEAIDKLKILEGKSVRMEKDKTNKDRYGRYLRYIFLGDNFVNLELIQGGLAYAYIVSPDKKYEKEFLDAEAIARASGVGVWKRSVYSDCISMKSFHYNAKGDDNENLVDEFFVVESLCGETIVADGWTVRNTFNSFQIPSFSLNHGSEIKIISGKGKSNAQDIFLSSDRPIWNNKGDNLYLRDASGDMILSESYVNS
jgi:endonuclease YncB( thermonuclease family)